MTSTITKQEYSVYYGISELKRLQTAHSLAFDTETLQLQPEEGKLRLIQLGSVSSRTIVVIDCFELERSDWNYLEEFSVVPIDTGWHTTQCLISAGYRNMAYIPKDLYVAVC